MDGLKSMFRVQGVSATWSVGPENFDFEMSTWGAGLGLRVHGLWFNIES
jgi:hypothetical protein